MCECVRACVGACVCVKGVVYYSDNVLENLKELRIESEGSSVWLPFWTGADIPSRTESETQRQIVSALSHNNKQCVY